MLFVSFIKVDSILENLVVFVQIFVLSQAVLLQRFCQQYYCNILPTVLLHRFAYSTVAFLLLQRTVLTVLLHRFTYSTVANVLPTVLL